MLTTSDTANSAAGLPVRRFRVSAGDGVQLAVEERGYHDAEHTVVLAHGLCLSQVSWRAQIRLLQRRLGAQVRIVSYDHRGHGHSDPADMSTYTIEQLGRDHAAVLDAAAVAGPVTLVGHSMGAMALLEYLRLPAGQRPLDPDGLVLVATAAGRLAERGVGRLLGMPVIAMAAEVVSHAPRRGGDRALRAFVQPVCRTMTRVCGLGDAERDTLAAAVADAVYSTPLSTAAGFLRSLRTFDAYSVLAGIQARTVVVSGGVDLLTPLSHAQDLVDAIPGATHRHLPAAGHMLLHEAAHAVADEIARTVVSHGLPRIGVSPIPDIASGAAVLEVAQ